MPVIGVLMSLAAGDPIAHHEIMALQQGLQELGWTDGRNMKIEYRWAAGDIDRMRTFAKELVGLQPEVIVARATPVANALARETRTIPIVFAQLSDPVGGGLVSSLAHPGGNVTGFTNVESSMSGKVAGVAQGDRAERRAGHIHIQPSDGPHRRIFFPRTDRGRRALARGAGDHNPGSQRRGHRTSVRRCCARAGWRPHRDAGHVHSRSS